MSRNIECLRLGTGGFSVVLILVFSLLLHGCSSEGNGSASTETLSGYVVDDALVGAEIQVMDLSSGEVVGEGETDSEGYYELEVSKADAYHVKTSGGTINGGEFLGELRAICGEERLNTCYVTPLTTLADLAALADGNRGMLQAYEHAQANQRALLGLTAEDPFITDYFSNKDSTTKNGNPHSDMTLGGGKPFDNFTPGSGNPHTDLPRQKGNPHTGSSTGNDKPHSVLDLVRLRARIGNGEDFDALLRAILDDLADGTFDGDYLETSDVISPDEMIARSEAIFNGDPSIPQTSDDELEKALAPSLTPKATAEQRRLEHNHDLVLHAVDPEPSWFSTRASTNMLITTPGDSHTVDLVKLDSSGNVLGPVDKTKLRIELRIQHDESTVDYIPAEYQADYVSWDETTAGRLNIKVPADLDRGRLVIAIRPDFDDAGQAAIAERWSVPILVDVWPLKANVTQVENATVYYPVGSDGHIRTGSSFDAQAITGALQQASLDELLAGQLLKAMVVKGMSLVEGQLIDYRLPDVTGGIYPYGGRVVKVIDAADGQQLVLLNFEILAVYDAVIGGNNLLVKEGVMPEFVTYRSGESLPAITPDGDAPLDYFGPAERSEIQESSGYFIEDCDVSAKVAYVFTPYFTFDPVPDAGLNISVSGTGGGFSCNFMSSDKMYSLPIGGAPGALLQKLTGTGLELGPYGSLKFSLSAGVETFSVTNGFSLAHQILFPPKLKWLASSESGLDAAPMTAKASIGGEFGAKLKLSGIDVSVPWIASADLSLTGKLGLFMGLTGEGANAAAANANKNSKAGLDISIKSSVALSDQLKSFLNGIGVKGTLEQEWNSEPLRKLIEANYMLGSIVDDGQGSARVSLHPGVLMSALVGRNKEADGYTSLSESSVYNDPNTAIDYDVEECKAASEGKIISPLIGCMNGFFCGQVAGEAKLCGGQVHVTPLSAYGNTGDWIMTTGFVTLDESASDTPSMTVSLSGDPLQPTQTSTVVNSGIREPFTAETRSCPSTGVHIGTVTASTDSSEDVQRSTLSCECEPGTEDCDRLWGDPYLLTADGMAYDFIASGDYILQQVVDETGYPIHGLEVQARFLPGFDVSWPYATAMQVGNDVVEITPAILGHDVFSIGMEVKVNGTYVYPPALSGTGGSWEALLNQRLIELPGGGLLFVDSFVQQYGTYKPRILSVVWPANGPFNGYGVRVSMPDGQFADPEPFMSLQFLRPDTYAGRERGMMGNNDGDPSNDFMRRNGEILGQDAAMSWTSLYGLFGGDWLVKPSECLFSDGCMGEPDFPTTAATLTPEQRALGEAACAELTGFYKEACIHDVGLSGSIDLVKEYYANTDDLNAMAEQLQTPGVDLPVYSLIETDYETLPENTSKVPAYRQGIAVHHVTGDGRFMINLRPPRGASAVFANGQPGALTQFFTGEGDLSTSVDVLCGQPDPVWADFGEAWLENGAIQLWILDPLSGFASQMVSEIALSCNSTASSGLAAGNTHTITLDDTGGLWSWGYNTYGQLGDGTKTKRLTPVAVDLSVMGSAEVVDVVARENHSLALDNTGRVWAWGRNNTGQLGDGTTNTRISPVEVDLSALGGSPVTSIATGMDFSLAVDVTGRLWSWGDNWYGQIGDGTTTTRYTPVEVDLSALAGARVTSVAAGVRHTVALDTTGRLWAWGENNLGELGDGSGVFKRLTPGPVDMSALGGHKVDAISVGEFFALALDDTGRLWAWGDNRDGMLGDGSTTNRPTPVPVDLSALWGKKVVSMSAGSNYALALDESGQLWAWGGNYWGQLGDGSRYNTHLTPVAVDLTALGGAEVVNMVAGDSHSLALDDQGRLWGWGEAYWLGDFGSTSAIITPVFLGILEGGTIEVSDSAIVENISITAGQSVSVGALNVTSDQIATTLRVESTGFDLGAPGQSTDFVPKGDSSHNLYAHCETPGTNQSQEYHLINDEGNEVLAGSVNINCLADIWQPVYPSTDGGLDLILTNRGAQDAKLNFTPSAGVTLSDTTDWDGTLAQDVQQTLSLSGLDCPFTGTHELGVLSFIDDQGQIYGQQTVTAEPAICHRVEKHFAAGDQHSLAMDEADRLWGWGVNDNGELGNGTTVNSTSPSPVDLSGLNGIKVVSLTAGGEHNFALDESGQLWAWGRNDRGQLGDGTTNDVSFTTPVKVDQTALGTAKIVSVASGYYDHNLALDENGRMWSWGYNASGQLGDGTQIDRNTPVEVDLRALGGVGVVSVAAGADYSLALDYAGRLWAWGANDHGQLGANAGVDQTIPVEVDLRALGDAKVVSVAAGYAHTLVLDDRGRVWSWGYNKYGQLGSGSITDSANPIAVTMGFKGTKVVSLSAGNMFSLALDEVGRVWAWGQNGYGQLGIGSTYEAHYPFVVKTDVAGAAKIITATTFSNHSLALDELGHLWAWGLNSKGQLGNASVTSYSSRYPVRVDDAILDSVLWKH